MKSDLTQERLKALLHMDPESFRFTWKVGRQCIRAGSPAGTESDAGYRAVLVDGSKYQEHRLVWLYVHGIWPDGLIDHINGDKSDNRLENLRVVDHMGNMQNQPKARKTNRTGFAGVRPHGKKFQADIRIWGERRVLGTFETAEQAYEACRAAKQAAGIPTNSYTGVEQ